MRIKAIVRQHRRDFVADYVCESCGHVHRGNGYDDTYFHREVIPDMRCPNCGKASGVQTSEPIIPPHVTI